MSADAGLAKFTTSGSCPFWCERDIFYGEGVDRHLWHQTLLADYDQVTISLVRPHGAVPGYPDAPQWRLELWGEELRLPEGFSTWTYLDLMWGVRDAANRMEDFLRAVPDGDTTFESLDYSGPLVSDEEDEGVRHD